MYVFLKNRYKLISSCISVFIDFLSNIVNQNMAVANSCFTFFFNVYYFWESENRRRIERGRHIIWTRLQALSCWHRARCGAQTHRLWDHDLRWSRTLNQLSHPDAPYFASILLMTLYLAYCPLLIWSVRDFITFQSQHLYAFPGQ